MAVVTLYTYTILPTFDAGLSKNHEPGNAKRVSSAWSDADQDPSSGASGRCVHSLLFFILPRFLTRNGAATGPSGAQTAAPHPSIINQRNAHLEHQLAQRRARKPNDRNMPEGLEDITIGNGVHQYKELREVERRLDYAMMRKRLEISDSSPRMNKRQKTMRIWISNTAENQPWQEKGLDVDTFDFSTGVDGTYRVKVEGRLLDDAVGGTQSKEGSNGDEEKETTSPAVDQNARSANPEKRFSEFFKAISIDYHQFGSLTTDGPEIHWQRQPNCAEFDALEFERQGDDNINITINLTKTENPERFQLSKALADVLDTDEADRNGVVMGIWDYVRAMNLQGDEEKRAVRCDDKLRAVSSSPFYFFPRGHSVLRQSYGRSLEPT